MRGASPKSLRECELPHSCYRHYVARGARNVARVARNAHETLSPNADSAAKRDVPYYSRFESTNDAVA